MIFETTAVVLVAFSPLCTRVAMHRLKTDMIYVLGKTTTCATSEDERERIRRNAHAHAGRSSDPSWAHPTSFPELLSNDLVGLDELSNASVDAH
jgi:hypothetical protein